MDRFIDPFKFSPYKDFLHLKSNMDRFIDKELFFYEMFSHI